MFDIFRTMKRKEEEEEEDFKKKMTKGAILVLDGVPKDVRRDAIKEQFKNYGTCSWVDLDEEKAEVFVLVISLIALGRVQSKETFNCEISEPHSKIVIHKRESSKS